MNSTRSAVRRMAAQAVPTDEQLRRAAPGLDREVARIPAQPRLSVLPGGRPGPASRLRPWGPALVAAAVVAVLVGTQAVLQPGSGEDRPLAGAAAAPPAAARPPVGGTAPDPTATDPAAVLRRLADLAAAQPAGPAGPLDHTRSVHRHHTIGPDGGELDAPVVDRVEEVTRELWTAADGSGRTVVDATAAPGSEPMAEDLDETRPPGAGHRRLDLPGDPAALVEALIPVMDGESVDFTAAADVLDLITGLRDVQIIDPPALATLLRMLADTEGLRVDPGVVDLAGREGIAVRAVAPDQADDLVIEKTLVLDPDTGALLGADSRIVRGGPLPDRVPLELMRSAWLESGRVGAVGERP